MQKVKIELTMDELKIVVEALHAAPYAKVAGLLGIMQQQIAAQERELRQAEAEKSGPSNVVPIQ